MDPCGLLSRPLAEGVPWISFRSPFLAAAGLGLSRSDPASALFHARVPGAPVLSRPGFSPLENRNPRLHPGENVGRPERQVIFQIPFPEEGVESLVRFGRKAMEKRKELFKTYLVPYFSFSFIKKIKTTQRRWFLFSVKKCPPAHSFYKGHFPGLNFVASGVLVSRVIRDSHKPSEALQVPSSSLGIFLVLVGERSIGKRGTPRPGAKHPNGLQGQSLPTPEMVTQGPPTLPGPDCIPWSGSLRLWSLASSSPDP